MADLELDVADRLPCQNRVGNAVRVGNFPVLKLR